MKLRLEFENIRANIVNRGITNFDSVLGELLREETRLRTQANLDAKTNNVDTIFFASRSRPPMKKMTGENGIVQCRFCGEMGHIQSHCKKRNVCNYCKKKGHVILKCHLLQRNKHNQATLLTSNGPTDHEVPNTTSINLTQDAIQQVIQSTLQSASLGAISSAFSAAGLSVNYSPSGCVIQDLQTRKVIEKGHKQGQLFPLNLDIPSTPHCAKSILFHPVVVVELMVTVLVRLEWIQK
ncbi:hypothetical protein GH714_022891 [Hevea brasiliensis]|uniref:CCHC-type domain-containing protein n=1 Tax=Hevea brasiliensis TaxID=3981 RepID=A0A6A6KWR0_HEVBR|nr:hypothetical protein GH714_022891 [Hevea brasiliensis]